MKTDAAIPFNDFDHLYRSDTFTINAQTLERAFNSGNLFLEYQPQIDLSTLRMTGAEALLRWQAGTKVISPVEFIPVAEQSNLISPIGEWVIREACYQGKKWNDHFKTHPGLRVSVNLSAQQFNEHLPDLIFSVLDETGLPPHLLDLEITESLLVTVHHANSILNKLRSHGVHLSIDDFGTGFSCLAYLKNLPLHTIKIDRSFVTDLDDPLAVENRAIVESIIHLAHKLKRTTLAEGVETEQQAQVLRDLGCFACQGYLFSKPLRASKIIEFIDAKRYSQN